MVNDKLNSYVIPKKLVGNIFIDEQYIYKVFIDCNIGKRLLNIEYDMYNHMNMICDNFKSFDTMTNIRCFNHDHVLRGIFNPDMVNFGLMLDHNYMNIIPLLKIIDTTLRPNNFFHGDFKQNNIIFNVITNDIQIIDLEFSRILIDNTIITDEDACLSYYIWDFNNMNITNGLYRTFGKRYLFLYDMFKLVASIFDTKYVEIYNELFINFKSDTYLDFLLIYNIFIDIGRQGCIIPCRYMNKIIKHTKVYLNDCLKVHYNSVVKMIDDENISII